MAKAKQIKQGQKFGKLTILKEIPFQERSKNGRTFLVECECGRRKEVLLGALLNGTTQSCGNKGCKACIKHGKYNTQIYKTWQTMIYRCAKTKKCGAWENYGKNGIRVCEEWSNKENGFVNFYNWSMKNGYKEEKLPSGKNKYTIDRIDGTKGYSPDNCRWVEYSVQCCNHRILDSNKSGYTGISWNKQSKKWICVISINNHSIRIKGAFKTQKEAVEARNKYIDENNLPHKKNIYKGELSNGY